MANEFSLIDFIDRSSEVLFYQRKLPSSLKKDIPQVIALQGQPGAYAGMFALPDCDVKKDFHTFTGEAVKSNGGKRHIIGEETCRILHLLENTYPEGTPVYNQAIENMNARIHETDAIIGTLTGNYCCGTCSCSFWRNLAIGSFDHREQRMKHGMKELKNCRLGNGRWRRFPFYYTLLALSELDSPEAHDEITYALPVVEKLQKRQNTDSMFGTRRKELLTRILATA